MKKILLLIIVLLSNYLVAIEQKPIVVIIPSYNNELICRLNLDSVRTQEYDNFCVIYINDCSSDETGKLVDEYVIEHGLQDKFMVFHNDKRRGALYNIYHAVHSCPDDAIILTLDGDDFFANQYVLGIINYVYQDPNVWLTYGQYIEFPSQKVGFCRAIPYHVVMQNKFREDEVPVSHLRTFYAWLFKKIDKEDLMYKGEFFQMTWDKAMMWPMLEMCGPRFRFVADILYIYNNSNPLNDHKVDKEQQVYLQKVIKNMSPYKPLCP